MGLSRRKDRVLVGFKLLKSHLRIPGALSVPTPGETSLFSVPTPQGCLEPCQSFIRTKLYHIHTSTEGNSLLYIGVDTNFTGDTIYSFHLISKASNNGLQSDRNCKIRFGDNDSFPLNIKKKNLTCTK